MVGLRCLLTGHNYRRVGWVTENEFWSPPWALARSVRRVRYMVVSCTKCGKSDPRNNFEYIHPWTPARGLDTEGPSWEDSPSVFEPIGGDWIS